MKWMMLVTGSSLVVFLGFLCGFIYGDRQAESLHHHQELVADAREEAIAMELYYNPHALDVAGFALRRVLARAAERELAARADGRDPRDDANSIGLNATRLALLLEFTDRRDEAAEVYAMVELAFRRGGWNYSLEQAKTFVRRMDEQEMSRLQDLGSIAGGSCR